VVTDANVAIVPYPGHGHDACGNGCEQAHAMTMACNSLEAEANALDEGRARTTSRRYRRGATPSFVAVSV
jgi:hypothetical protein